MLLAEVVLDVDQGNDPISPLIYGQYLEHVADCVYGGVSDVDSPHSDAMGLRTDVQQAAAELGVPVVRWPGGCFADVYHWQDGIGPPHRRPVRRNWHWGSTESNRFGTDEFLAWCERIGAESYLNVNLGTGTLDEALRWLDYCAGKQNTADVRNRVRNGRQHPYRVGLCGIGNEAWARWEAGAFDLDRYARTLGNWADFVRGYDPAIAVLGVGSQEGADPAWDREVLNAAGKHLGYLTNHLYGYSIERPHAATEDTDDEYLKVVFTPVYIETRLRAMAATVAAWQADTDVAPIQIALDEWNIRHYRDDGAGGLELDRASPRNLQDAVFAAGVLNAMVRMAPDVGMANYVFLVNGNGVLRTYGDCLVKTTLYHVFRQYRQWMRGTRVDVDVYGPDIPTPNPRADRPGYLPELSDLPSRSNYLDAAAARDGDHVTLSLVNRHPKETITVTMTGRVRLHASWTLTHEDVHAVNDINNPEQVVPTESPVSAGATAIDCPPHSVMLVRGTVESEVTA